MVTYGTCIQERIVSCTHVIHPPWCVVGVGSLWHLWSLEFRPTHNFQFYFYSMPKANSQMGNFLLRCMWRWESQGSWKRGGCTAREAKGCSGKQSMCAEWQWLKGQPTPITHQALAFSMHGLPLLLLTLHDKDGLCANLSPLQYFLKGICTFRVCPCPIPFIIILKHFYGVLWLSGEFVSSIFVEQHHVAIK
jgi:hypothetical protein